MKHEFRAETPGRLGVAIAIKADEYRALVAGRRRALRALDIEEKLDLLLENYVEFEEGLLSVALRAALFREFDWVKGIGQLQLINRRITNLLSSARLCIDHVKHDVAEFFGRPSHEPLRLKGLFSARYDQSLEYRVGEALRNFAQHRGLPVHALAFPADWEVGDNDARRLRLGLSITADVEVLQAEGGLKAGVLDELRTRGIKRISLAKVLRLYVQGIGAVYEDVRRSIDYPLRLDEERLAALQARSAEGLSGEIRVSAVAVGEDGSPLEEIFFSKRFAERRSALRRKNRDLASLGLRYVSGAAEDHEVEAAAD